MADALPGAALIDSTCMMDRARVIKTAEEVAMLMAGPDLPDDVFLDVFRSIWPGVTERVLHA